jgi:hypothetical protein
LKIGSDAGSVVIGVNGEIDLEGEATVIEDLRVSLVGQALFIPAGKVDYDFDNGFVVFQPGGSLATANDVLVLNFQMPHSVRTNSSLELHLHLIQSNTTERIFQYQYRVQRYGAEVSSWSSTVSVSSLNSTVFPYTSGNINQVLDLGSIPGIMISDIIQIKLVRSDSNAGDVNCLFIDSHYEVDSMGSSTEYVK